MEPRKKVCVIGAGPSGLVAIKELRAEGHTVECFEAAGALGGVFSGPGVPSNRIYQGLLLTISNYYMAFSDFMPKDGYRYWSGPDYLSYLHAYAEHFKLAPYIQYNTRVERVERVGEKWQVTVGEKGKAPETRLYDAVAVCSGTHQVEKLPDIQGLADFKGPQSHAMSFLEPSQFAGKRVAVVGMGESAADIVREISNVSAECHLVLRSYPFCVPRLGPDGIPFDSGTARAQYRQSEDSVFIWLLCALYTLFWLPFALLRVPGFRWWNRFPKDAPDGMGQTPRGAYLDWNTPRTKEAVELMAEWHSKGNLSFGNKFATKNVSWLPNVLNGKIKVRINELDRFTADGMVLKDGTHHPIDAVVHCTGYKDRFPFLADPSHSPLNHDVRNLFKHAFNLQAGPSLCFIGFSRPTTGAIPACSELVARYFAQILSGNASIPANAAEITREDKAREDAMFCNSLAVRTVVNPTDYMDSLARLIGCYVHPLRWWYNPRQYIRWLSAMSLPCRYRYVGPGANPQVAEEWNAKRLTVFTPQRVVMLSLWKALYCLGVFSGDIFVDMRKLGVEVTREAYGRS